MEGQTRMLHQIKQAANVRAFAALSAGVGLVAIVVHVFGANPNGQSPGEYYRSIDAGKVIEVSQHESFFDPRTTLRTQSGDFDVAGTVDASVGDPARIMTDREDPQSIRLCLTHHNATTCYPID